MATSTCMAIFICCYIFLRLIKIGEPFKYLYQSEMLNISKSELTNEVYPVTIYSSLIALIPVVLFTDISLYKPFLFLDILSEIAFRATMIWSDTKLSQQIGFICSGIFLATEVVFPSYVYAYFEPAMYQSITGWMRASSLAGRALGCTIGQMILLLNLGDYMTVNKIAFVIPCIVMLLIIALPKVRWQNLVSRFNDSKDIGALKSTDRRAIPTTYKEFAIQRLRNMHHSFFESFRHKAVIKWSLWMAVMTCMSFQFVQFSQPLWGELEVDGNDGMNGFAEAIFSACAALTIVVTTLLPLNWDKWGELAFMLMSAVDTVLIWIYAQTNSIWIMYLCNVIYRCLYRVMQVVMQFIVAEKIPRGSHCVVFACSELLSLILQTILTIVICDKRGLALPIREQYVVYCGCHVVITLILIVSIAYTLYGYRKSTCRFTLQSHKKIYAVNL